jgi:hypothetical protein
MKQTFDIEAITGIPMRDSSTYKDLGTSIILDDSAEMYSNSILNKKEKKNRKENTFQQSNGLAGPTSVNVSAQAPTSIPTPAEQSVRYTEETGKPDSRYGRRLNYQNDKIVEICMQVGNARIGDRYNRASAYLSIRTETDVRYMIFMRSSLTTALDETIRSVRKDGDKALMTCLEDALAEHSNQKLWLGRVRYKPINGFVKKEHRKNLPLSLLSMWIEDDRYHAKFDFLGDEYLFVLDEDLSTGQKKFYDLQGTWRLDEGTLSMQDAFGI